jgi:hypothetical protein
MRWARATCGEFDWVQHHTIVAEETFFDCGAFPLGNAAWQCIEGEKDEKIDPFICRKAPEQTMLFMIIERFKDNDTCCRSTSASVMKAE